MIKSYISEIELRLQTLKQLLGESPEKNEEEIRSINEKLKQFSNKLQKDIKVKYEKIKRFTDNYHQVVDLMLTSDKVNIVVDELEELKQTASELDKIQKLLPVLNSDQYVKIKSHYNNLYLLATCSEVKVENNSIELVKYDPTPLQEIREQHRCQMNSLIELNQRIVNNLGEKLKAAHKRRLKK